MGKKCSCSCKVKVMEFLFSVHAKLEICCFLNQLACEISTPIYFLLKVEYDTSENRFFVISRFSRMIFIKFGSIYNCEFLYTITKWQ